MSPKRTRRMPTNHTGGLMTFNFLEPQDKDYDDKRIVELTKDEVWAPQNHDDDLLDNMRHVRTISTTGAST
jgi:hypothetical protein